MQPITTTLLVNNVRDLLDEVNTESVSPEKILRQLNMAARDLYHTAAKQYDQMYMESASFVTDGSAFLTIPSMAFGRRIEFITYLCGNEQVRIEATTPSKLRRLSINNARYPAAYTTSRDKIELYPIPGSGLTGNIHYMKKPATLVGVGGRIIDIAGDVLTIEGLDTSAISTSVDDLKAFFHIIDRDTGLAKGLLQVAAIAGDELTIKTSSLSRASVYGIDVESTIPTTAAVDDYICPVGGTCVLEILSDYSDLVVYQAMALIKGSLRIPLSQVETDQLNSLKKTAETMWSGRENDRTVTNKNPHFAKAMYPRLRGR